MIFITTKLPVLQGVVVGVLGVVTGPILHVKSSQQSLSDSHSPFSDSQTGAKMISNQT